MEKTTNPVFVATFADEVQSLDLYYKSVLSPRPRSEITAVGLEQEAQFAFQNLGFRCKNTVPFLDNQAHHSIFLEASRFVRYWYRSVPKETLEQLCHDGISFPESLQYDIAQVFTEIFLQIEFLKSIVEREHPDPLILVRTHLAPVDTFSINPRERFLFPLAEQICASAGVSLQPVENQTARKSPRRTIASVRPTLVRVKDLYKTIRLDEAPFPTFFSYFAPQALNRSFLGKILNARKLRAYRHASRKIIFWGGTRAKTALYRQLSRHPESEVVILTENGPGRLQRFLLPGVDPRALMDAETQKKVTKTRRRAQNAWNFISNDFAFQEQLEYRGVRLWPVVEPRLTYYVTVHFPSCVEFYEGIRAFLEQYGGDLLVSSVDVHRFTPWVYAAFSQMEKESIYFWHGLTIPNLVTEEGLRHAFLPLGAKRMAAFGTAIADWYTRKGVSPERIRVVGFPDLGSDFGPITLDRRNRACRILGLSPEKPIVVYATSITRYGAKRAYSEETADEILRATQEVLEELGTEPNLQLVIKLHPGMTARERQPLYEAAKRFPRVVVCHMLAIRELIRLCDALITYQSSAGIEALAHNKNVVVYNTTGRVNQYTPYAMRLDDEEPNFVVLVDDRTRLKTAVRKVLYDETLRQRLQEKRRQMDPLLLRNLDGQATSRALRFLEESLQAQCALHQRDMAEQSPAPIVTRPEIPLP